MQNWTGGFAGSNANDYFTVLTPDGTKYWFGYGREVGNATAATNSAFNVPVVGNHLNDACHVPGVITASWCFQTWRFNLDRIQDRNGNVATFFWVKEQNRYARNNDASLSTVYDRGGYLSRVDYGKRAGSEATAAAPARMTIDMAYRCGAQSNCAAPTATTVQSTYPDVPLDLMCTSATSCPGTGQRSPSFWSVFQVSRITARSLRPGTSDTWDAVDQVDFRYSFPPTDDDPNDGYTDPTSSSLWLGQIIRTGTRANSAAATPLTVEMRGSLLPNRFDHDLSAGVPKLNKYRITSLDTELGGQVAVTYGQQHPCPRPLPDQPNWDVNAKDCYPQWTRNGTSSGWAAFNKYQVSQVEVDDGAGPAPHQLTRYRYADAPAWHYDDSLIPGEQSWSDFRGHSDVYVETMTAGGVVKSKTRHRTFRGMQGDKLANGTAKNLPKLRDDDGLEWTDHHYLAGYPLEEIRMDGVEPLEVDIHRYSAHQTVAGPTAFQQHAAQYVREVQSIGKTRDTTGGGVVYRKRQVSTTFEWTYGLPTSIDDSGDLATGVGATCTTTSRTPNTSLWLIDFPNQVQTYQGNCGGTRIGKTDIYYDGSDGLFAAPSEGNPTAVAPYWDADNRAVSRAEYDDYGRVTKTMSANENARAGLSGSKTTTTYAPPTGLPTAVTVRNPLTHTVRTDFVVGLPSRVTDANGNATAIARDELGRVTAVTRPGDAGTLPSLKYAYSVGKALPSRVMTSRLLDGTRYVNTFSYVDGLGRVIETQAPSPSGSGRVVTATRYNDQGQVAAQTQPMFNSLAAATNVLNPQPAAIPHEQRFTYDALGRQTVAAQYKLGAGQWQTTTSYTGVAHTIDFPVRTDLTYLTDVFGRTTRVVERPTPNTQSLTNYTYTPAGQLDTITDAAGHVTNYDYDWLGRRTRAVDPNQGTWTYTYDPNGNRLTTTDALVSTVTTDYDVLDRRTKVRKGMTDLAVWTYDTALEGIGLPHTSTRIGDGNYVVGATGYDGRGRATGKKYTIPGTLGALAGEYVFDYKYDQSDNPKTLVYPEAGTLPEETVTTTYNDQGAPATLTGVFEDRSGSSTYVAATTYFGDGQVSGRTLGAGSDWKLSRAFAYNDPAGRLTGITNSLLDTAGNISSTGGVTYGYDPDGNLLSAADDPMGPATTQHECFQYDRLNRLTAAFTTGQACSPTAVHDRAHGASPYSQTFTYDDLGRMLTATGPARTYTYPTGAIRPHAASSDGTEEFTYDANGAVRSRTVGGSTTTYDWDDLHQLTSVAATSGTTTMVYDADGNRLVRRDPGGTATLYLDGTELRLDETTTPDTVTATRYYGSHAMRTDRSGAEGGLWWTAANRQNSTSLAVKATDGTVRLQRYKPFGESRETAALPPTERGFLGKTHDPTGLDHLGARYHDSGGGRFVSVDPVLDLDDPQSLNPYSYARNNPTTMSDPTGLAPACDEKGKACQQEQLSYQESQAVRNRPKPRLAGPGLNGDSQWQSSHVVVIVIVIPYHHPQPGCVTGPVMRPVRSAPGMGDLAEGAFKLAVFDPAACESLVSGSCGFEAGAALIPAAKPLKAIGKLGKWLKRLFRGADDAARAGGGADNVADGIRLRAQLAGDEIAGGHAFDKHVVQNGEYPGVTTRAQFARTVENVITNGEMRPLANGRSAYWHDGTVVIRDPKAADGGTAFRPTDGYDYFLGLT